MGKYCEELTEKIVSLIEEDNCATSEICRITGINRDSFYEWKKTKPEFARALKDAENRRVENLKLQARKSVRKKLEGYTRRETKTVYVRDVDGDDPERLVVKEYIVKEKHCPPDTRAIAYVLSKVNPEEEKEVKPQNQPLVIIVQDQETKRQIEILQENSRNPKETHYTPLCD